MIEWDERKRARNLTKHGVDFALVARFEMSTALVKEDTRVNYGEARFQALGFITGKLHMLVFTMRGSKLRVISLRNATGKEAFHYGEHAPQARKG